MRKHVLAAAIALSIVASGCSGNKQASDVQSAVRADRSATGGDGRTEAATRSERSRSARAAAVPAAHANDAPSRRRSVAGSAQTTKSGFKYRAANLFTPAQDRQGITPTSLTLCMHFPQLFGPAFHVLPKDFPIYWRWLNDHGGIYGRKVNLIVTDDQYSPSGGVQAAQQCASSDPPPFLITGFLGVDTAPGVRQWAEENHQLYLSPLSTESGFSRLRYSFGIQPSVEQLGLVLARYVAAHWPGGSAGIVWRNSPNWKGARDTAKRVLASKGARITDLPITERQGNYTNEVLALKRAKATTVLAAMSPVELIQLEKQAAEQGYYPRWGTATLNLTTDTIGDEMDGSKGPPAVAVIWTPEYHNGDATSPWSGEQKAMRAAYAKYDSDHTPNDIDWINWLTFKLLAQMFRDCGRDCTRNKLAGMFLSGYNANPTPLCPIDFARGGGKLGSFAFNVSTVVRRNGAAGWKQVETCKERF